LCEVAGVLVPNSLPEVLMMAAATGGYKANGWYGELYIAERNEMMQKGSREVSGIDDNLHHLSWCSGDESELTSSEERIRTSYSLSGWRGEGLGWKWRVLESSSPSFRFYTKVMNSEHGGFHHTQLAREAVRCARHGRLSLLVWLVASVKS
jgi:hypothetical protein